MRYQRAEPPLKLNGFAAARDFFAGCFAESDPARECLFVAHLDGRLNCIHLTRHEGGEAEALLPVRSIIADAARCGSSGILLSHTHPSGDPRPSRSDCLATRRLAGAADGLDCTVIDHLIFAGDECTSFRRMGLL
jgi:DNA repair protein RadC